MKIDYLIVGQGLAGTVVAYHLLKRKKKIAIVDEYRENSSSRVAAGLFNPITGRRFVKTWNANKLFPYLDGFYRECEKYSGEKFYFPTPIYRPFSSVEEQNDWQGNSSKPDYEIFIDAIFDRSAFARIKDPFGGILIKGGGFLDLPLMLTAMRKRFLEDHVLLEENFEEEDFNFDKSKVMYKNIEAEKIVFCRGALEAKKSFFSWLPFRPVKGEVLHLRSEQTIDKIYNKACFITPARGELNKCGSTYDWRDTTTVPTEKARNTIFSNLQALINWNVEIVDQKAGIRPATLDRRPLIGLHPELSTHAIFNGLGTKGVTLAPYYADQFVKFLEDGTNVDEEVNIERYYSLYYNSFSEVKNRGGKGD